MHTLSNNSDRQRINWCQTTFFFYGKKPPLSIHGILIRYMVGATNSYRGIAAILFVETMQVLFTMNVVQVICNRMPISIYISLRTRGRLNIGVRTMETKQPDTHKQYTKSKCGNGRYSLYCKLCKIYSLSVKYALSL